MAENATPDSLVLVQELVNTLDVETGEDALVQDEGAAAFARRHGLSGTGLTTRDLAGLRELREELRAVCLAHNTGADVPDEISAALEKRLGRAPLTLALGPAGTARVRPAPGLGGLRALTARIAADIAAASAAGEWKRLKVCETHDCLWAFYDRSPAGRRRWCTMSVCGSRAKMRTYRARKARDARS